MERELPALLSEQPPGRRRPGTVSDEETQLSKAEQEALNALDLKLTADA
jgi:hypothetical protein